MAKIELLFDASLALERLDDLLGASASSSDQLTPQNQLKDFGRDLPAGVGTLVDAF